MATNGLLIGEIAARTGSSRKALRLYERTGILTPPGRTPAGYRVYEVETLGIVTFVRRAQGLGFTLDEIKEIVAIKRAGRVPCSHVRDLVRRKANELDVRLKDLMEIRYGLRSLLGRWGSSERRKAAVCPHIESAKASSRRNHQAKGDSR
jgi:DNA-binding transcriptional MerR regulator